MRGTVTSGDDSDSQSDDARASEPRLTKYDTRERRWQCVRDSDERPDAAGGGRGTEGGGRRPHPSSIAVGVWLCFLSPSPMFPPSPSQFLTGNLSALGGRPGGPFKLRPSGGTPAATWGRHGQRAPSDEVLPCHSGPGEAGPLAPAHAECRLFRVKVTSSLAVPPLKEDSLFYRVVVSH